MQKQVFNPELKAILRNRFFHILIRFCIACTEVMQMDKTYRKMRARLRKRREEPTGAGMGFLLRMFICLVAFLAFAGIRLRGGQIHSWAQNQVEYYMRGERAISQAYDESVEAINQLCDRIIEAQNADD